MLNSFASIYFKNSIDQPMEVNNNQKLENIAILTNKVKYFNFSTCVKL